MKYEVCLTRDVTESVIIHINAENREQAQEIALDMATDSLNWARNDNDYNDDTYISWCTPEEN